MAARFSTAIGWTTAPLSFDSSRYEHGGFPERAKPDRDPALQALCPVTF
jgi:hypothetical protein